MPLAAPGVGILSTAIGNTYRYRSGTSMAVPHVSGSAALLLARCPLDSAGLKRSILENVDPVGALTGWVSSGGRLNVYRALRACVLAAAGPKPAVPTGLTAVSAPGAGQVSLSWNAVAGAQTYNIKKTVNNGEPYTTVGMGVTATRYVYDGMTGRRYYFVVSAVNGAGEGPVSAQVIGIGK